MAVRNSLDPAIQIASLPNLLDVSNVESVSFILLNLSFLYAHTSLRNKLRGTLVRFLCQKKDGSYVEIYGVAAKLISKSQGEQLLHSTSRLPVNMKCR